MQPIYMQRDDDFQVFTTVLSPQVCRSRTRTKPVEEEKVVAAINYRPHEEDELELRHGDVIQVVYKEDHTWWFGRLQNGNEGYFPSTCVERHVSDEPSVATPNIGRRCSVPIVIVDREPLSGSTCSRIMPKLPRKTSIRRALGYDSPSGTGGNSAHSSPSLLHRVLNKSRRMSCPAGSIHSPHADPGSVNTAFQPD